jgi:chemotaxis protein MotB
MSLARARRGRFTANYWPGFVDMLSTLLLVVTFLMALFMLSNFVVTQATSGKDTMLSRLNRQLSELTELLALERSKKESAQDELSALQATLGEKDKENQRLTGLLGEAGGKTQGAEERAAAFGTQLDTQKKITNDALAKVEMLNQQLAALRLQLTSLQEALDASDVLFDSGSAELKPEALAQLDKLANALKEVETKIPPDIAWVMRVDGHTDIHPIATPEFPSNWELSSARAISVVRYLMQNGISPDHLVAAGFGEFQPIDPGTSDEAFRKNRRIELKLTER